MSDSVEFDKICQEFRGAYQQGRLKISSSTLNFKNQKTNKAEQIPVADIESAHWLKRSKGYCFKLVLKSGNTYRFDGFSDTDLTKIEDVCQKNWKMQLEKNDSSQKGWNWGKTNFVGDAMNFEIDGKLSYDVPLKNVSNTNVSKNEVILQFHQNDQASVSLMEIRYYVPSNNENDNDSAQEFYKKVMKKADIISAEGDAICTLTELNCLTPRGRYDVKFFTDFIDLHGKTFDYKIAYTHILRLFLLPHKDNRQMYFVMALDPPIKQGQTRYPFLIVLFNNDDSVSIDVTFSEKTKISLGDRVDKLDKTLSGPYHEVLSRICRAVLDKRITVPGNFTSAASSKCLPCSYKANSGFLYPLERGFMFVHKPPLHILFQDIDCVTFSRSNQGHVRSFDFEVDHKNGTKHTFNSIEKNEQENLLDFVKQKGIKIKKSGKDFQSNFQAIDDEDRTHDPYAERMKAEGREKANEDDDDDDEEDEDFEAGSDSGDDDLEYDSNVSVASDSDEDDTSAAGSPKKKQKTSPKKSSKKASPTKSKSTKKPETTKKMTDAKAKSTNQAEFKSKEFVESASSSDDDEDDDDESD